MKPNGRRSLRPVHPFLQVRGSSLALVPVALLLLTSQVHAVAPSAGPAPFHEKCPGTTQDDPTSASGALPDLTAVSGARLTKYNAGKTVPLYDSYGDNDAPYPPLCSVHSEGGVPVSEWMFCTDAEAHACGETNARGDLVADGVVVGDLEAKSANPKLTPDQERVIAFLIQHGHTFTPGPGAWAAGGTSRAASDQGTNERVALQELVWCVSDQSVGQDYPDFAAMCNENLPEAERSRILATVPQAPVLDVKASDSSVPAGSAAEFAVETNLFNVPIHVHVTGGSVALCPGNSGVTLSRTGELVVEEKAPAPSRKTLVCVRRSDAGTVDLSVAASPASPDAIAWDQSAYPTDGEACQHYATFRKTDALHVSAVATAQFMGATVRTSGGTLPTAAALPDTGA